MKRILFCLNHPSDFFTFKYVIPRLISMGYEIKVLFSPKVIIANLPWTDEWDCINLCPKKREPNFFSSLSNVWQFIRQYRPHLVAGTDPVLAPAAALAGARSLFINQYDVRLCPLNAWAYRWANRFFCPESCDPHAQTVKRISYRGCHHLAYLRGKHFHPDEAVKDLLKLKRDRYFIIRLTSEWSPVQGAENGLDDYLVHELIALLEVYGQVFVSAGRELAAALRPYALALPPEKLHDAVYYAEMFISDGHSMAAEAAVMGVPAVWMSSRVGKIGYMRELEEKYQLLYGVPNAQPQKLLPVVKEILATPDVRQKWKNKRKVMSVETADVTELLIDAIRIHAEKRKV